MLRNVKLAEAVGSLERLTEAVVARVASDIESQAKQRAQQAQMEQAKQAAQPGSPAGSPATPQAGAPSAPNAPAATQPAAAPVVVNREVAIAAAPRIKIETPKISGSIANRLEIGFWCHTMAMAAPEHRTKVSSDRCVNVNRRD